MKSISKKLRKKKKHNKIRLCAYNSPYNPEFVKKVLEAANGPFTEIKDIREFLNNL